MRENKEKTKEIKEQDEQNLKKSKDFEENTGRQYRPLCFRTRGALFR